MKAFFKKSEDKAIYNKTFSDLSYEIFTRRSDKLCLFGKKERKCVHVCVLVGPGKMINTHMVVANINKMAKENY